MNDRNNEFPPQPEDAYAYSAGPAIGITDILVTLRRDWRFPIFGCLIGLTLAVSYLVFVPPLYQSSARILLDRSVNRYLQTNKIVDEPTYYEAEIGSQVSILSSESIVVPVVRSMNLANDSEFASPPSAGGILRRIGKLIEMTKQSIGWNDHAAAMDADAVLERTAVANFMNHLRVVREADAVIDVSFASEDPNKAAKIANSIADTYIATTLEAKFNSTNMVSKWLQDRLTELKKQATDADRALQDYKAANNLVNTGKGLAVNSEQLSNLTGQLALARIATSEARARLDHIHQVGYEGTIAAATVSSSMNPALSGKLSFALNNSDLLRLRQQYNDLAIRANEIESRVGPRHDTVVRLRARMGEMRKSIHDEEQRIADSYADEYQIAKARESELAATVAQLVGQAGTGSQAEVTMRELQSSADTLRNLYNSFLQKFEEINTIQTQNIPVQDARIITRAVPPLHKTSKKRAAGLAGGIMLGLFLGAGAALAREWAADVFRTSKAVEQVTDISCVILPMVKRNDGEQLGSAQNRWLIEEFVLDAPYSRFTETLRNIKALINTAQVGQGAKVIGVVSSVSKEGKTTVAANLAALMVASSGARTLIIDADLHLRHLTTNLAPDAREGLIEALDDPSRLATLVTKRERSGVDILPCVLSTRFPNAAEVLGSPKMEQLLLAARKAYDYVIIEIAPIMSVVDAKMIERSIDRFIFVVEWGQTKRSVVLEALSEVQNLRERLISIVLNKADAFALRTIEAYKGDRYRDYYQEVNRDAVGSVYRTWLRKFRHAARIGVARTRLRIGETMTRRVRSDP